MPGDFINNLIKRGAGIISEAYVNVKPIPRTYSASALERLPFPSQIRDIFPRQIHDISQAAASATGRQKLGNAAGRGAISGETKSLHRPGRDFRKPGLEHEPDPVASNVNFGGAHGAPKQEVSRIDHYILPDINPVTGVGEPPDGSTPAEIKPARFNKTFFGRSSKGEEEFEVEPPDVSLPPVNLKSNAPHPSQKALEPKTLTYPEPLEEVDPFAFHDEDKGAYLNLGSGLEKLTMPPNIQKLHPIIARYPAPELTEIFKERNIVEDRDTHETAKDEDLETGLSVSEESNAVLQRNADRVLSKVIPVVDPKSKKLPQVPIGRTKAVIPPDFEEMDSKEIRINIGTIEIRADAQPAMEPAPQAATYGFDEFAMIRRYKGWEI